MLKYITDITIKAKVLAPSSVSYAILPRKFNSLYMKKCTS